SGAGERSYFDIRSIYYYGFSQFDHQGQIPVIHPVLDYSNVLPYQLLGGEFSYKANLTSLTRQQAEFNAITQSAQNSGVCQSPTADTAIPANCLLRGVPGNYTRASAEVDWRRTLVTDNGQMITPFLRLRGQASASITNQACRTISRRHRTDLREECRRRASNTAIRSSACLHGERKPSSRSLSSLCAPTRRASVSSQTKMRRAWFSTPAICLK